jgi:ribonuclease G
MQQVVINAAGLEKRTALLQNGKLVECAYQRPDEKPSTGSIYKGRVQKVLPGMQAVFVDIGTDKNGFLHRDDLPAFQHLSNEDKKNISISSLIKEGESVLVQIAKEETGDKGPKLTALLSFTGHLLVYFPFTPHIGVSKKIKESYREALLKWGSEQIDVQEGMVIRTGCQTFPEKEMDLELKNLKKQFTQAVKTAEGIKAPNLIIRPPFYYTFLERWLNSRVEEIIVDDHDTYSQIKEYAATYLTPFTVRLYNEKEPIFKKYGIEVEIQKSLFPHVWLKNGASLYFNVTEALTVIDVNTGKFTGKKDRTKTVAETNALAAKEIMKQLRLRNLAGMIVIDFITMQAHSDKDMILSVLMEEIKNDSSTINLYGFTKMGLFELTRKKERPSLLETLAEKPRSEIMESYQLRAETFYYELERIAMEFEYEDDAEAIWLEVPEYFAEWLKKYPEKLSYIEKRYGSILFITSGSANREMVVRQTGDLNDFKKRFSD